MYLFALMKVLFQNLTGGIKSGIHITDVTNASRTLLMNIEHLIWDPLLLRYIYKMLRIL